MRYFGKTLGWMMLLLTGMAGMAVTMPAETLAEKTLKEIYARQQDILAKAEKEGDQLDQAWLRGELQNVINSYDVLIQKSPDFAAAYVPYGMLLGKVGMTKEAVGILLKANKLDPNIPVVKNQLAKYLAEDGKPAEALPWIMAAIDLAPREPLYHYQLGLLLTVDRDVFINDGEFTRAALDKAMLDAFAHAAEFAPDNFAYAYRHAEAYYDLAQPKWDEALQAWTALEDRAKPGVEKETIRLHAANVLLKMGQNDRARALLAMVHENVLQKQKQTLLDQMAAKPEK